MRKWVGAFFLFLIGIYAVGQQSKITCYGWMGGPGKATDAELKLQFDEFKKKGLDGLMYSAGHDPEVYRRVGRIAKASGLGFHAWIPTMVQGKNPRLKPEWYAVNGRGESAYDKPAYVDYYKFLCPNREEVVQFLEKLYAGVAAIPEVDGVHLDYIRFPDVILARGLWEKYGLVMDREYPEYDYCYCNKCIEGFKSKTGIDITSVEDPSGVEEWKQYRYDLITGVVNKIAEAVRPSDKIISAAVFPGPHSVAKKIVRQEWDKWNIDAFYPMNYNDFYLEGTEWIGEMCKEGVSGINKNKPLYSGLFICPDPESKSSQKDPENHGLVPGELEAAIRESVENGAAGICLFTPSRMTEKHWEIFREAISKYQSTK